MNFNLRVRFIQSIGRRFIIEWLIVGSLGIAIVLLNSIGHLTAGADRLVYDRFVDFLQQPTTAEIAQFARQSWPRGMHTGLLDTQPNPSLIYPVDGLRVFCVSLVPLAALLAGFLALSPRRTLLLTVALCGASAAASELLLYNAHQWISPLPAIVGLIVMYPIWSWRRLEMTLSYLRRALQSLADEPSVLLNLRHQPNKFSGDLLEQHLALMAHASRHMQDIKRFIWDSLNSVPEPILVCDLDGVVLIANQAAKSYFARLHALPPERRKMCAVFGDLDFIKVTALTDHATAEAAYTAADPAHANAAIRENWPALLDPARREYASTMERGIEVRDRNERDHLLRYAKCTNAQGVLTGWIADLVDVSAVYAAERQREDALALLSHDMRSPQVSIVALVEIERTYLKSDRICEVLDRIERYALRALALADNFVQLARAESQVYVWNIVSLVEIAINASEEVWPQAHAKQIQLKMQFDEKKYWIRADPSLMTRALVNLFNNAVKYSPPGTHITCTIEPETTPYAGVTARVRCVISDQGYGMSAEQQVQLFERFRRFHTVEHPKADGAGLGLVFVKTVIMRHGGTVQVDSRVGVGTTFIVLLPVLDEAGA